MRTLWVLNAAKAQATPSYQLHRNIDWGMAINSPRFGDRPIGAKVCFCPHGLWPSRSWLSISKTLILFSSHKVIKTTITARYKKPNDKKRRHVRILVCHHPQPSSWEHSAAACYILPHYTPLPSQGKCSVVIHWFSNSFSFRNMTLSPLVFISLTSGEGYGIDILQWLFCIL